MEQEEKKEEYIIYKIVPNRKYRIWRKDYNGSIFYNIKVEQKQYDNTKKNYYIPVTFKKGVSVDNETDIIIKKAIENIRDNNYVDDKKKPYSPIFSYMITEFEICEREEQQIQQAYDNFRDNLNQNEEENADDIFY